MTPATGGGPQSVPFLDHEQRRPVLDRARELGLEPSRVLLSAARGGARLERTLGIDGNPDVFLVLPGGFLGMEVSGYRLCPFGSRAKRFRRSADEPRSPDRLQVF